MASSIIVNKNEKTIRLKMALATKYYNGRCQICHNDFNRKLLPVYHHRSYMKNDIRHADYKCRYQYMVDLSKEINKDKSRFNALCNKCHNNVTWMQRYNIPRLKRLFNIVLELDSKGYDIK